MRTIAFFNNKGGVGKTSLVYHLAWMYAELGVSVVAADLDPQANLTASLVGDARLEEILSDGAGTKTIFGAIRPQLEGTGDLGPVHVEPTANDHLGAVVGDLSLSGAEAELNAQWPRCMDGDPRAFRVSSLFWRVIERAAALRDAKIVLIDVGPNLGAMNRAALLAADDIVVPLAPDLYSLRGLENLGPALRTWRSEWEARRARNPLPDLSLPRGLMRPIGYIVMQHAVRLNYPVTAYERWIRQIPTVYRRRVLGEDGPGPDRVDDDPNCLALLKHYRSLMAIAQEARKPMFLLRTADGAIGSQARAVRQCYDHFQDLAKEIARRAGVAL